MAALHHLGEHGGWRHDVSDPRRRAVLGGTLLSTLALPASPPSSTSCARSSASSAGAESVEQNRSALMARLSETARPQGKVVIDRARARSRRQSDRRHDRSRARRHAWRTKVPQPMMLEFLWRPASASTTGAISAPSSFRWRACARAVSTIISAGGFSRYSSTKRWLTPHFEKMLYDNALLLELLALAWQRSGNELFRTRAHETVRLARARMTTATGASLRLARRRFRRRGGQILCLVVA